MKRILFLMLGTATAIYFVLAISFAYCDSCKLYVQHSVLYEKHIYVGDAKIELQKDWLIIAPHLLSKSNDSFFLGPLSVIIKWYNFDGNTDSINILDTSENESIIIMETRSVLDQKTYPEKYICMNGNYAMKETPQENKNSDYLFPSKNVHFLNVTDDFFKYVDFENSSKECDE